MLNLRKSALIYAAAIAVSCGQISPDVDPEKPEEENPFAELTMEDFAGRWDCMSETWDLTKDGTATLVNPANLSPIRDEHGNPITMTVQEYCQTFADAYNTAYVPEYGEEVRISPEDVAVQTRENVNEEDYTYFTFDAFGEFEFHQCQYMAGLGHFNTMMISGTATFHPESGTFTLTDESNVNKPRRMVLTLVSFSEEKMELSIKDTYPWLVSDFAGQNAYEVECTTVYGGTRVSN